MLILTCDGFLLKQIKNGEVYSLQANFAVHEVIAFLFTWTSESMSANHPFASAVDVFFTLSVALNCCGQGMLRLCRSNVNLTAIAILRSHRSSHKF